MSAAHTVLLDGLDLVSGERGDERFDRRRVAASYSAACACERDEFPGHRSIRAHRGHGAVRGPKPRLEPGDRVGILPRQLVDRPAVAAQHRPMHCVIAEHLGDPEQIDVIGLERARALLLKKPHDASTHAIATSRENSSTPRAVKNLSMRRQHCRYQTNVESL